MARLLALLAIVLLTGCESNDGNKYEAREAQIERAFEANAEGFDSKPVWLVKASYLAVNNRTAVFFGYIDNRQACEDFAKEHNEAYPEVSYSCDPLG